MQRLKLKQPGHELAQTLALIIHTDRCWFAFQGQTTLYLMLVHLSRSVFDQWMCGRVCCSLSCLPMLVTLLAHACLHASKFATTPQCFKTYRTKELPCQLICMALQFPQESRDVVKLIDRIAEQRIVDY